jgi:GT2 family glycosyltransferase
MDGTCVLVTKVASEEIGLLDEENFGRHGWGASLDYGIRARRAGLSAVISHRAYLNHMESVTANKVIPDYQAKAIEERDQGLRHKYGEAWKVQLASNKFMKFATYLTRVGFIRSLARRVARSSIGRKLPGLLR